MEKRIASLAILVTLLLLGMAMSTLNIQPVKAEPRTIYVDDDNTSGPWNGTWDYPYQYIQDAVDAASDGDTIIVKPGTYYEWVDVFKSLNIKSYSGNPEDTIVNASGSSGNFAGFEIDANYVNISGFTVTGFTGFTGIYDNTGIFVYDSVYANISNNKLTNNRVGIWLYGANYTIVENNNVSSNTEEGIRLYPNSNNNTIQNNNAASNSFAGIILENSNNNTIQYNDVVSNNQYGIQIYLDNLGNTVSYNNLINNTEYDLQNIQSNNITAENNWWGTTNSTTIDSNIQDNDENPSYGEVDFIPYLNAPYPDGQARSPWSRSTVYLTPNPVYNGSSVEISALISDNLTSIPIADYYTEIYANDTMISNGTSNANGWYNYTWTPSTIGTYIIKSTIYNDTTKNYIAVHNETETLTVLNNPPSIDIYYPPTNPSIEEGQSQEFNITYSDPDGDPLSVQWYLDGTPTVTNDSYTFIALNGSAGVYNITVVISDGLNQTSHEWTLTVYTPTQPVGGIHIPINKLELLAPYIGLTTLLAVAITTVVYIKKRK